MNYVCTCRQVHRLDAPTGGILMVAKTRAAIQSLSAAFAQREVKKTYMAIVCGRLNGRGSIEVRLRAVATAIANAPFGASPPLPMALSSSLSNLNRGQMLSGIGPSCMPPAHGETCEGAVLLCLGRMRWVADMGSCAHSIRWTARHR